jgi:hypothetical protein
MKETPFGIYHIRLNFSQISKVTFEKKSTHTKLSNGGLNVLIRSKLPKQELSQFWLQMVHLQVVRTLRVPLEMYRIM